MRLLGVDIDGTIYSNKAESHYDTVEQLRQAVVDGDEVVLVTSRSDPAKGQELVWDQWGVNLPCVGMTRDWPNLKGDWLLRYADVLRAQGSVVDSVELWDDEIWYLNPASMMGIKCKLVVKGALVEYQAPDSYEPWQPKTDRPAMMLLPMLK